MKIAVKRTFRTAALVCLALGFGGASAAMNDYIVFKLKDGKQVEGKVVVEDLAKFVVEHQLRGITRQETIYRHNIADFQVTSPPKPEQRPTPTIPTVVYPSASVAPAQTAPVAASLTPEQAIQQLRQWAETLQNSKQQLATQIAAATLQVEQQQRRADASEKEASRLRAEAAKPPTIIGYRNYDHTRPIFDNTAQNDARNRLNSAQLTSMTDASELTRRQATLARLEQQGAAIDQQLATAKTRFDEAVEKNNAQQNAVAQKQLAEQMTNSAQNQPRQPEQPMQPVQPTATAPVATAAQTAAPVSSPAPAPLAATPPASEPSSSRPAQAEAEIPWYEKNLKWIVGGLAVLWILSRFVRVSR